MIARRGLLMTAGSLAALGAVGIGGSLVWCNQRSVAALPLDRLDIVLSDIPDAGRIGRAFLAEHGAEQVAAAFLDQADMQSALSLTCDATRRSALRAAFRADFARGDCLTFEGWILSRSECLVAALRTV
ncbi:MAG: hypothetical protein AAF636_21135 [Pseudomonadota bacterium]